MGRTFIAKFLALFKVATTIPHIVVITVVVLAKNSMSLPKKMHYSTTPLGAVHIMKLANLISKYYHHDLYLLHIEFSWLSLYVIV